jgi:alpha-L-fucosidase 2
MYKEAGPVIETPLAGAEAIHDMLLQSWGGVLRIFPAMPAQWRDTAFHDLRAEGGFLVSAVREGGEALFVRVRSLAGEPCFVRSDLTGRGAVRAVEANHGREDRSDRVAVVESGLIRLDIRAGEDIVLYVGERVPDLAVRAVRPSEAPPIRNYFGGRTPWRQYGLGQGCRLSCQSRPPGE